MSLMPSFWGGRSRRAAFHGSERRVALYAACMLVAQRAWLALSEAAELTGDIIRPVFPREFLCRGIRCAGPELASRRQGEISRLSSETRARKLRCVGTSVTTDVGSVGNGSLDSMATVRRSAQPAASRRLRIRAGSREELAHCRRLCRSPDLPFPVCE
jgi:hypothetical protein